MKYTTSIEIGLPREKVVQLVADPAHMPKWLRGLTRLEPADLHAIPSSVVVHYDREIVGEGMWQAQRGRIIDAGPDTTLWESESEFRFDGLLMRLMGRLMPGTFRKQSRQHMQDFKAFAEQGTDIRQGTN
jgi:hypothetical protein